MAEWKLTGKPAGGGECEHCGRALAHRWEITSTAGDKKIVGRGCLKAVTGWTITAAEAARQVRYLATKARRDATWAAFTAARPDVAAAIEEDIAFYTARVPTQYGGGAASEAKLNISEGCDWMADRYTERRAEVRADVARWPVRAGQ